MMPKLGEEIRKAPVQLAILFITLILFLVANALFRENPALSFMPPLFGLLIVFEIIFFVTLEVKEGAVKHGWKHEIVDTVIALVVALAVWYGASFVLNTNTPISGVVSCSMLPNLQRGDFVVVQGAPVRAHEISMTPEELASLNDRAFIDYNGTVVQLDGSLFPYCIRNRNQSVCRAFIQSPESVVERKGAFTYRYERCPLAFSNGSTASEPCLKSVTFRGTEYVANFSNDIIVYQPAAGDVYSAVGDIVHRTMFAIDVGGKKYYLTRGDNNPILDIQVYDYGTGFGNTPVSQERTRGKVIARIPLLGYFKLFISGYFQEDPQCRMQLEFTHN